MAARGHALTVLLLAAEPESELTSSTSRSGGRGGIDASLGHSSGTGNDTRAFNGGGGADGGESVSGGVNSGSSIGSANVGGGGVAGGHKYQHGGGGGSDESSSDVARVTSQPPSTPSPPTFPALMPVNPTRKGARADAAAVAATATSNGEISCGPSSCVMRVPRDLATIAAPSLADTDLHDEHLTHHAGGGVAGAPTTNRTTTMSKQPSVGKRIAQSEGSAGGGGSAHGGSGNSARDAWMSEWAGLLDVNIRCAGSRSCPLHEAAASGSVGAVLSLLDLGADVSITNGCGDTALHVSGCEWYIYADHAWPRTQHK